MVDSSNILTAPAVLRGTATGSVNTPVIVHRDTRLSDLPTIVEHDYVLVSDDGNSILGMVATRDIDRRLRSANRFERSRWESMPIGGMLAMALPEDVSDGDQWSGADIECAAIQENGNLFGLSVDGDLFLSWKRLESLFADALSDPLTGLMNRVAFQRRLREEWDRSERVRNSIGIVMVDLDDFKVINDTYGHVVGDSVLAHVGHQLEMSIRSYDVIARFGGDEFVALCLGCSPGQIEIPIRRVLDRFSNIALPVGHATVRVEASIGAAVRHDAFDRCLPEDLFIAADQCLYEAKRSSSNSWMIEFSEGQAAVPQPLVARLAGDPKHSVSSVGPKPW